MLFQSFPGRLRPDARAFRALAECGRGLAIVVYKTNPFNALLLTHCFLPRFPSAVG